VTDRIHPAPRSHIELLPTLAVLPFTQQLGTDDTQILGNVISDDLIAALSSSQALRVLSRMSTMNIRDASWSPTHLRHVLNISYAVSGSYRVSGDSIFIMIELCDTVSGQIVRARRGVTTVEDLFTGAAQFVTDAATDIAASIVSAEVSRTRDMEVRNLADYTLYIGAINLLDKLNRQEFLRSKELLGHLQERAPRQAAPHAMQAKWHVMNLIQRWSSDRAKDTQAAQAAARRALELNADYPFALAIDGLADVWLRTDLDSARKKYEAALAINPNEVHAWAFLSGVHSYLGDGPSAEFSVRQALTLSPLDPALYYFEAYAALAAIVNDQPASAVHWAESSLRRNGKHLPSHKLLVIGHALAGDGAKARQAAVGLNEIEPHRTLSDFLGQYPGRDARHAVDIGRALRFAEVVE
jgi:TolB-like protein